MLRVAGEVNLDSLAALDAALDDVLDRRPDHLIVDLTGLVFCSSQGLAAITRTANATAANGTRYSMSGAWVLIARLWPNYWPDGDAPPIHGTTAAAVLSAILLQADQWKPVPTATAGRAHPVANEHDLDNRPVDLPEKADDTDPPSPTGGHQPRPDAHETVPAALRQALHRHRSRIYRNALRALGASHRAHPLAPDLDAQLRTALAGLAATPPHNDGSGRGSVRGSV